MWTYHFFAKVPFFLVCFQLRCDEYCFYFQNMYEDGDEEMKRTIAKAWTDARSGKAADPLKRFS